VAGDLLAAHRAYQRSGKHGWQRREMGEEILTRRNGGQTMYDIAADLGIGERTAYRYLDAALDARIVPKVDQHRKIENEKLDYTERQNEEQIDTAEAIIREGAINRDADLVIKGAKLRGEALALRVRIAERRAKLNGLDAPIVVNANVTVTDPNESELQEMIREAQAKVARQKAGQ
jgi:hypothetical protein